MKRMVMRRANVNPGDIVWCNIEKPTTKRGNSYIVRNVFYYKSSGHTFITIKNDDGWTVKVNALGFRKRHPHIQQLERLELRIKELELKFDEL